MIALNIAIIDLTGSPAAVAGIYMIRPIAILLTNTWAGSVIDRVNKRRLMAAVDFIRGAFVFLLPFMQDLWAIYAVLLLIHIAGSFFGPSSTVYITKLIPSQQRKRFNSLLSMMNSGAFILGPALGGLLIWQFGTDVCMYLNAATFVICGLFIMLLPDLDEQKSSHKGSFKWKTLKRDWGMVSRFVKGAAFFVIVYVLYQSATLIGYALDAQESIFIIEILDLSVQEYGWIVSVTGIGSIIGAILAAFLAHLLSLKFYLGAGVLLSSICYLLFYSSNGFTTALLAFVFLGFFMAFAHAGYATFFQNSVPVRIMGRVSSMAEFVQGLLQIILTLILGLGAGWFSLQTACLVFSVIAVTLSVILFMFVVLPSKKHYFLEGQVKATDL